MKKLSTVMAFVLLFVSCFFVTAQAEEGSIKVTASSGGVTVGQELTMTVSFSENTGFNIIGVKLTYPEGFTYVTDSAAPSALIAEKCYLSFGGYEGETYTFNHDAEARTITFIGASLYDITDANGTLFTAVFTAPDATQTGAEFTVEVVDDPYNESGDTVTVTPENGSVDVKPAYKLGDVDGSGRINLKDAIWVLEYVSLKRTFSDEEKLRANVNTNSSRVNLADAIWIIEYVSLKRTEFK